MKYNLGKTKDSRTRKQASKPVDVRELEEFNHKLKQQKNFISHLLAKGYSTTTVKRYCNDISHFLSWIKQNNIPKLQVSYSDMLHYIQSQRGHVKQRTISTNINSIKHYFNFLAITHPEIINPTEQIKIKGIKRKSLYDLLSKPELEKLYNDFETINKEEVRGQFKTNIAVAKRNKVILGLMIYQGLGTTELSGLTEEDVKLREGKIYISGTRRSNERTLVLEAHQIMDIMEYVLKVRSELLAIRKTPSDKLFLSIGTSNRFSSITEKLIKKLHKQNSKVTSSRQVRTSVITHWLKAHNLRQVQYMAGHRYVSSTEAFLVNDIEGLQEDIAKFHPL